MKMETLGATDRALAFGGMHDENSLKHLDGHTTNPMLLSLQSQLLPCLLCRLLRLTRMLNDRKELPPRMMLGLLEKRIKSLPMSVIWLKLFCRAGSL